MTISDLEHFKNLLTEREHNLVEWLDKPNSVPDGDIQKVRLLLDEIQEALKRTEDKTYGTCIICKGEVQLYHLEVQPVAQVCLECYTEQQRSQLEDELFLASKIHRALLPQAVEKIDGFDVAVRSIASRMVGGDYYDFLPSTSTDMIRVVVADTMGKGLPAGLLMSNVQGALRILSEELNSPKELISRLNRWLCRNVPVTKFISLICVGLMVNRNNGSSVVYTNAGHCPAILARQNGKIEYLPPTGGVIGVHEGFEYQETSLPINHGDTLLLYTDGIAEALNKDGHMFGEERIVRHLQGHKKAGPQELVDSLINEVRNFSGRTEFEDDLTLMVLRKSAN